MPVQKRSSENLEDDSQQRDRHYQQQQQQVQHGDEDEEEKEEKDEQEEGEEGDGEEGDGEEGEDSDGSPSSSGGDKDEYLYIKLSDIRKEVQCPICLGIIRKTRTVMECLHRFCRECIDKSMRLGNNECPACRTHCASRRSLRDDPNYDTIIATLYPDIDKYEEKELAFSDEEKTRNKHIQESIAQTFQRQSEALGRKRTSAKVVTSFTSKSQGNYRRGRGRNNQATQVQGSEDDEDGSSNGNGGDRGSSSSDEQCTDVKPKRRKRRARKCSSQPPSASANANVGCNKNNSVEVSKENTDASPGVVGAPEVLSWGKGGTRSHNRHGSVSGGNSKNTRSDGLVNLVDYIRSIEENDAGGKKEDSVR